MIFPPACSPSSGARRFKLEAFDIGHTAMTTLANRLTRLTTFQWWLMAVLLFWLATVLFVFVDFAGARWLGFSWASGPDLFPNMVLGYLLALFHILAAIALVASGIRLAWTGKSVKSAALAVTLVVVTGAVCFVVYALFAIWYHVDLMGRSL